jgi:SAM-dependent methyltransferase
MASASGPAIDLDALTELLGLADYWTPLTLGVAAALGIADHLGEGPRSIEDLARETGARPDTLFRVLRLLSSRGVFQQVDGQRVALTPAAQFLRSDHPISLRDLLTPLPEFLLAWSRAVDAVRTGKTGWELARGSGFFPYLAEHPEAAEHFNKTMFSRTRMHLSRILEGYDWSSIRKVVDVGGGTGQFLAALLPRNPHMRGVLFDQPSGLAGAKQVLRSAGVLDRCELVSGDFFDALPEGADAYVLVNILHDWDDDTATRILRNCRRAMSNEARLVVIDYLVPVDQEPHPAKGMDMLMLMFTGGRERTQAELEELLGRANLVLTTARSTPGSLSITEARPAPRSQHVAAPSDLPAR